MHLCSTVLLSPLRRVAAYHHVAVTHPIPVSPRCRSFVQQPANTAQAFRDLNAELAAVFGADSSQLLTPDGLRKELGAAEGADLAQLLLQSPPGSGPWCVRVWPLAFDCIRLSALPASCLPAKLMVQCAVLGRAEGCRWRTRQTACFAAASHPAAAQTTLINCPSPPAAAALGRPWSACAAK